jgi:hypothetical protein
MYRFPIRANAPIEEEETTLDKVRAGLARFGIKVPDHVGEEDFLETLHKSITAAEHAREHFRNTRQETQPTADATQAGEKHVLLSTVPSGRRMSPARADAIVDLVTRGPDFRHN